MLNTPAHNTCTICGAEYSAKRAALGYKTCLPCGDKQARTVKRTVAPVHKSSYVLITNPTELRGINNKTER